MEKKLYLRVFDDIINRIKDGSLKPGDKLDPEPQLARYYGVSRVTVNHAMRLLSEMNIIYRIKRSGTFINGKQDTSGGVRIPNIVSIVLHNTSHSALYDYAARTALLNNIFLKLYYTDNNADKERAVLSEILTAQDSTGAIIYPVQSHLNIDLYSKLKLAPIPFVFLDRGVDGVSAPLITSDNANGTYSLTNHLVAMGHRDIAFFAINDSMPSPVTERFRGYCDALTDNDIALIPQYIWSTGEHAPITSIKPTAYYKTYKERYCRRFAQAYKESKHKPTCVVCANDAIALTLIDTLNSLAVRVPQDLSVTGFDNIAEIYAVSPTLTTVGQDFRALGETAISVLLNMPSKSVTPPVYAIPVHIIHNGSVVVLPRSDTGI